MGYTILVLPKITPQFIVVHGATRDESRLNPGTPTTRPAGLLAYLDHSDLYGDDPTKRTELWQTSAGTATEAEIMAACPRILDAKYAALWQAAHDYEYEQISGSAVGLLALGVIQQKPKCTAVQQWIASIWTIYYQRKAGVRFDAEIDTDYSQCGNIPHTVPELMEEVLS